jgi:uncharacterized membrane protein YhaH (DUF805 family)
MRIGRMGFVVGNLVLLATAAASGWIGQLHPFHLQPDVAETFIRVGCGIGAWTLVAWRAHDFNESAWRLFWIEQVPFIGQFEALWMLLTTPGTDGMNSYGHPFPI